MDRDRLRSELEACRAAARDAEAAAGVEDTAPPDATSDQRDVAVFAGLAPPAAGAAAAPDVGGATAVLGGSIALDDLKVVEGIGPKIEQLCHGIGIATWADLATTEVSLLRTMLTDAGPRFRTHDPSTWPQQAGLLAHGRWGGVQGAHRRARRWPRHLLTRPATPSVSCSTATR